MAGPNGSRDEAFARLWHAALAAFRGVRGRHMNYDRYAIGLLFAAPDAPELDEQAAAALQDAHMSHLADLHEAGVLLAAGPLFGEEYRGLSILNVEPERARELDEQDPAVRAGLYSIKTISWMVPGGVMSFSPGRLPRSVAEAGGR